MKKIQKMTIYKQRIFLVSVFLTILFVVGCGKQLDELRPHNVIFEDAQFDRPEGYSKAVTGLYALVASGPEASYVGGFTDQQIFFSEAKGNTIKSLDAQINRLTDVFDYINSSNKDLSDSYTYWRNAYNVMLHINKILGRIAPEETNPTILQAKGEALFMRAYVYFNLVRLYGKPYYQEPNTSPGVMLVLMDDLSPDFAPARASVEEVYQQVIADLEAAMPLLQEQKSNSYASRSAADALLSRVQLYRGGTFTAPNREANEKAFTHADRVIREGGYTLLQGEEYRTYYDTGNIGNKEDIFAINGEYMNGQIASRWKMPPQINYTGGLYRPSPYLLSLMEEEDMRWAFYVENLTPGFPDDNIAVNKYNIGYDAIYSRSPYRVLRLAEMYLNRAEALVKLGRDAEALADVNTIRQRAGLEILSGLSGEVLFREILKQRKIELAFEGHASYDEFRNGLPMVRNYVSGRSGEMTVQPTDPGILMQIPDEEIADNPNLVPNPR
ncbi:hypothetical protein C5749_17050 [Sphingobacterium gobiense]|uniref:RagB/SusD family nutrient uptake outer membrane protein n=2 Tax=Sphingobacterium gobiense TaxID=1382456 RepID=A0A2S9JGB6_9SPHI|nr:hypothetical protein C5749_17050 [Sphingobacterium gobiense]